MPTAKPATTANVSSLAGTLKSQLEASSAAMIYVPLNGGDAPSDDELTALLAQGIHAELDVVRGALAVRAASPDEIPPAPAPASSSSSSTTTS